TRSVEDAALVLAAVTGGRRGARYLNGLNRPLKGIRIGICDYFMRRLAPAVDQAVRQAIRLFEGEGATTIDVSIPEIEGSNPSTGAITLAEAVTYHEKRLLENPDGIGPAVRGRLEGGFRLSAVDLVKAEQHRSAVVAAFGRVFGEVDCLVGATTPWVAA